MNKVRYFLRKNVRWLDGPLANQLPIGEWSTQTSHLQSALDSGPIWANQTVPRIWFYAAVGTKDNIASVVRMLDSLVERLLQEAQSKAREVDTIFMTITLYGWEVDRVEFAASGLVTNVSPEHRGKEVGEYHFAEILKVGRKLIEIGPDIATSHPE